MNVSTTEWPCPMYAHKLIEALRMIERYPPDTKLGNGWPLSAAGPTAYMLADRIAGVPKFEVTLELLKSRDDPAEWEQTLTAMGEMNLLKLPFPEVYVEFPTTNPDCINFMLCWQEGEIISVFASYFDRRVLGANIHTNYYSFVWDNARENWDYKFRFFYGPNGTLGKDDVEPEVEWSAIKTAYAAKQQLGTFLVLLATRNTILKKVEAPPALNKKRTKKGKVPLFSHTIIDINREQIEYEDSSGGERSHASPRIHLRRGHIRTLDDDRKTFVRPCIVGVRRKGVALHDYRLR